MYITPDRVKAYTEFEAVRSRPDSKLETDILRAETEIFTYCGHKFEDATKYPLGPPEEAQTAIILLSEYYALIAADVALAKGYKSETFSKYSYTLGDNPMQKPAFTSMLAGHVQEKGTAQRKAAFRMRGI